MLDRIIHLFVLIFICNVNYYLSHRYIYIFCFKYWPRKISIMCIRKDFILYKVKFIFMYYIKVSFNRTLLSLLFCVVLMFEIIQRFDE